MKIFAIIMFMFIGFQSFSMTETIAQENKSTSLEGSTMQHADRKKRINRKRKRKCSQWGKRSFAG